MSRSHDPALCLACPVAALPGGGHVAAWAVGETWRRTRSYPLLPAVAATLCGASATWEDVARLVPVILAASEAS